MHFDRLEKGQYGQGWRCFEVGELSQVQLMGAAPDLPSKFSKPPRWVTGGDG